jgi:hypothetical protein
MFATVSIRPGTIIFLGAANPGPLPVRACTLCARPRRWVMSGSIGQPVHVVLVILASSMAI